MKAAVITLAALLAAAGAQAQDWSGPPAASTQEVLDLLGGLGSLTVLQPSSSIAEQCRLAPAGHACAALRLAATVDMTSDATRGMTIVVDRAADLPGVASQCGPSVSVAVVEERGNCAGPYGRPPARTDVTLSIGIQVTSIAPYKGLTKGVDYENLRSVLHVLTRTPAADGTTVTTTVVKTGDISEAELVANNIGGQLVGAIITDWGDIIATRPSPGSRPRTPAPPQPLTQTLVYLMVTLTGEQKNRDYHGQRLFMTDSYTVLGRPAAACTAAQAQKQACTVRTVRGSCHAAAADGTCTNWNVSYSCRRRAASSQDRCFDPVALASVATSLTTASGAATVNTQDFPGVQALLEAARQGGSYGTVTGGDAARVFAGTRNECRDKFGPFNIGDCCKANAGGPASSNRAALAAFGVNAAIDGVQALGSPHVHDMLFLTSDLQRSLSGLGQGLSGLSGAFSPSFSLYGLQVGLVDGALSFGFDPVSFAVALGFAVLANMVKCTEDENILGLRRGRGLCVYNGNYCARRHGGLFGKWRGCKEEREAYCCYNSRLALIVHKAAKEQLGIGRQSCRGLTMDEFAQVRFDEIDFSGLHKDFAAPSPADIERLVEAYTKRATKHWEEPADPDDADDADADQEAGQ